MKTVYVSLKRKFFRAHEIALKNDFFVIMVLDDILIIFTFLDTLVKTILSSL